MTKRSAADAADEGVEAAGELVAAPELASARLDAVDDRPSVGSWWWVSSKDSSNKSSEYDRPGKCWLACVVEVGSNYAKVEGVRWHTRVALDHFHQRCTAEPNPDQFIAEKVGLHKTRVRELMTKIREICHRLGIPMRQVLAVAQDTPSQALAVAHGVADVKKYGKALVRAKEKTLPDLFQQIRAEHEQMAKWMSAELIPAKAELAAATELTEVIAGKIHTVELYAGLTEELVQVREGVPASVDERVRLMQRMHYMDEECLARYEAGGMDFRDVGAFDAWLSREENFGRIFPSRRCIVAFRVRRNDKDYGSLDAFIKFAYGEANERTFLYIRNGEQLWYLQTSIDFGAELFPDRENADLLGDDELWVKSDEYDIERGHGLITGRRRAVMIEDHRVRRRRAADKLRQWRRAGKPEGRWAYVLLEGESNGWGGQRKAGDEVILDGRPHGTWHHDNLDHPEHEKYELLTPDNIYHDDAMKRVRQAALEHNRVAVIVQGLLDRSTCLHPHPPWRIWTPEGFASAVELSYDVSRAIASGDAPDFEEYRRQLNRSLRAGSHAIGQRGAWREHMVERYGEKWEYYSRHGDGPKLIHPVERVRRDGACEFRWTRRRVTPEWVPNRDRPGYLKPTYPEMPCRWTCPVGPLTCVDAYTPGDFHLFYDDPRLRADYLQWAPILLACEDWHHARRTGSAGSAMGVERDDEDGEEVEDVE